MLYSFECLVEHIHVAEISPSLTERVVHNREAFLFAEGHVSRPVPKFWLLARLMMAHGWALSYIIFKVKRLCLSLF